ncbi:MAG: adenine phosphoribosyltransferase [Bacilli bacterium]|nr:adenine phosphoribosyltransferase [Bacilli bacterium]
MSEIKETNNILYRVEKNFPVNGVNFIDLTPTLTENNHFFEVSKALKELILSKEQEIDYIVSPDARGFLWGTYIASLLHKPLIPIRKHGKLPPSSVMATTSDTTEYSNIKLDLPIVNIKNKRCIFIDDVFATGGTFKACKKLINDNGGILEEAYVILDIEISLEKVNSLIKSKDIKID